MNRFDLRAQRGHDTREATGRHGERSCFGWPFCLDAPHESIDGVRGAPHDTGTDAVLGAAADCARRRQQFGRRQLRGPANELIGGRPQARHDHATDETALALRAIGGNTIEGGRRPEVDDDRVLLEALQRGERVDDAIGANGQRLIDIEHDRKLRSRIHAHRLASRRRGDTVAETLGNGWSD